MTKVEMTDWERDTALEVIVEAMAVFDKVTFASLSAVLIEWQRDDGVTDRELVRAGVCAVSVAMERGLMQLDDDDDTVRCDECGRLCGPGSVLDDPDHGPVCQYCVEDAKEWEQQQAALVGDCDVDLVRIVREEEDGVQ